MFYLPKGEIKKIIRITLEVKGKKKRLREQIQKIIIEKTLCGFRSEQSIQNLMFTIRHA